MFVLILATLLFPVGGAPAKEFCQNGFCITLNEGELTSEAGLCVVIPCSLTIPGVIVQNIIWYKCEPSKQKCSDSEIIFHTNKNRKVQPGFKGRVSLLEPDVTQNDCSIIINDLMESDSGSYQLKINFYDTLRRQDGLTFAPRATVSVKGLNQKPTVMIPPLIEGQQTTLTCTAPGLCSGSDPKITWTWRGTGQNDSHITGNITAFKTENLTAVTQRHSSTLTFNPSNPQHHNTEVTCKVSFTNNITTEETVTLNVTWIPKILKNTGCEVQSEVLTCVCVTEGFPLPTIEWPLLENQNEYSVMTTVSNHTVSSKISLNVKNQSSTAVKCVSSNEAGEVHENINIVITSERPEDQHASSAVLPWTVAAVSLTVNVICIICMMVLWNTRKKVKPNQEDRIYMSLQKKDPTPEYGVIGQGLK